MKPGEFVRRALLDKRAGRAGRVFDRAPELCEIGVRNGDGVELFVDRYQTRSLEDRDDLAGQAEFLRPNVGPVDRIDRRSGFGEKPEQLHAAAHVPGGGADTPAGFGDSSHLCGGLIGIRQEVEHELRERDIEAI